jgi:DNA-binding CsgD family transcriptional regulator
MIIVQKYCPNGLLKIEVTFLAKKSYIFGLLFVVFYTFIYRYVVMPKSIEILEQYLRRAQRITMPDENRSAEICCILEELTIACEKAGSLAKALLYHKQLLDERMKQVVGDDEGQTLKMKRHTMESAIQKNREHSDTEFERFIAEQYPTLTKTERRICSFVNLNMTSQQIADLLYTSLRTIEWHRLNIRKKLQIPDHQEIQGFWEKAISTNGNK